ncbi:MAG: hypothetical protein HGA90_04555 [Alphaproteobacteria bacterium]|nr:hypothetical protein [Alphaproteobacteria bacterium]
MKPTHILLILVLSAVLAFATASFVGGGKGGGQSAQSVVKETRLEQVKRTGVLRCGYLIWPPFNTKDPNTGKMGGFYYDLLEEMGRQLKLKKLFSA